MPAFGGGLCSLSTFHDLQQSQLKHHQQEAQLLLGDRATRKHAKDC